MDKLIEKAEKAFRSQRSFKASDKEPFVNGYLAAMRDIQNGEKVEYRVKQGTKEIALWDRYKRLITVSEIWTGDSWVTKEYYIAEYPDGGYEYRNRITNRRGRL